MSPRVAALLATVLVLSGCPRAPLPLDFGLRGRIDDPAEALEMVKARAAKVHAVRGEAKAKLDTPQGGGSLTQFVIAQAPDRVRLESIDFFGRPVAVLVSDGVFGSLFDVERHLVFQGPATAQMVGRLLPLRLDPAVLVALLLGSPPVPDDATPLSLQVDEQARAYVLTLDTDGGPLTLGLDPATLRTLWVRGADWRASFDDWKSVEELPRKVSLTTRDGATKVELSWRDREVNPALEDEVFDFEIPEGAKVQPL